MTTQDGQPSIFGCICNVPEGTPPKDHDDICRKWNAARLLSFLGTGAGRA